MPDVVESVLTKTLQRIVDDHSRTLVRSAVDNVVERGPFCDMLAATVEDITRAEMRAGSRRKQPKQGTRTPPGADRIVAKGGLQPTTPHNFQRRYTQTGREHLGEGEDTGLEPPSRGTRGEFVFPPGLGGVFDSSRVRKKRDEGYYSDKSGKSDATGDDTEPSDDDRESGVSHLRRIRPLNDLFRKVIDYRRYRLHNRFGRYNEKVARMINSAGKSMPIQMKARPSAATTRSRSKTSSRGSQPRVTKTAYMKEPPSGASSSS